MLKTFLDVPDKFKNYNIAIGDAVAEIHTFQKTNVIRNCFDLWKSFESYMYQKFSQFEEIHLIFDTYKDESIKELTRPTRYKNANTLKLILKIVPIFRMLQ